LGLRWTRQPGSRENNILRNLIICIYQQIFDDIIKKKGLGGSCCSYGGEKRCIQNFGGNPKGKRPLGRSRFLLENVIKMDPQQVEMGTWSGLKWLWIGSGCGKF
jgi:hypothetical protein